MAFLGNDKFSTFLTAQWNFSPADTTMSVNSVPPNLPTIITSGFDTPQETVFSVTGSSGGNTLTGITKLRGASVDLPQGTVIEVLDNEEFWNQYASAIFTQVGIKSLLYGVDGGSTDAYAITLLVAPASYSDITGVPIFFKANTVNTGAATLNVNSLGAKSIKTPIGGDPIDGQIPAGAVVLVVYDGTNFVLQTQTFSVIDDDTFAAASAITLPTSESVKAYVDAAGDGQVVSSVRSTDFSTSSGTAEDLVTVAITLPVGTSGNVRIEAAVGGQDASGWGARLVRDSTPLAGVGGVSGVIPGGKGCISIPWRETTPLVAGTYTYKLQVRAGGTFTCTPATDPSDNFASIIVIEE